MTSELYQLYAQINFTAAAEMNTLGAVEYAAKLAAK
jgi:hypothetical protein